MGSSRSLPCKQDAKGRKFPPLDSSARMNLVSPSRQVRASSLVTCLAQLQTLIVPSLDLSKGHEQGLDLALSDLHAFLSARAAQTTETYVKGPVEQRTEGKEHRRQRKIIIFAAKKLAFYLVAIRNVREHYGRKIWLELSQEVGKEVQALRAEFLEENEDPAAKDRTSTKRAENVTIVSDEIGPSSVTPCTGEPTQARIEEL